MIHVGLDQLERQSKTSRSSGALVRDRRNTRDEEIFTQTLQRAGLLCRLPFIHTVARLAQ